MKNKKVPDLYEKLGEIPDFRRPEGRMHELRMILAIAIMAIMSDYKSLRAMRDFITKNRQELKEVFKPRYGRLPSHQTIGRVFQNVDFEKLSNTFYEWSQFYVPITEKEWVSLDGKAIRGTVEYSGTEFQNFVSLITVFSNKRRSALMAKKIQTKKENEIPKVQEMIPLLNLKKMCPHA